MMYRYDIRQYPNGFTLSVGERNYYSREDEFVFLTIDEVLNKIKDYDNGTVELERNREDASAKLEVAANA